MAWTKEDFERLRQNRLMYLGWIEAIEGGKPISRETEDGQVLETKASDLADYKTKVAEIESILTQHGEAFDAHAHSPL
jgi:hypothetical protein